MSDPSGRISSAGHPHRELGADRESARKDRPYPSGSVDHVCRRPPGVTIVGFRVGSPKSTALLWTGSTKQLASHSISSVWKSSYGESAILPRPPSSTSFRSRMIGQRRSRRGSRGSIAASYLKQGKRSSPTGRHFARSWSHGARRFAPRKRILNIGLILPSAEQDLSFQPSYSVFSRGEIRVNFRIHLPESKAIFAKFEQEKSTIEAEFGEPLIWENLPKSNRARYSSDGLRTSKTAPTGPINMPGCARSSKHFTASLPPGQGT